MKDLLKKGAKGIGNLGTGALKAAIAGMLAQIVKEIMDETGTTNIAKDKMMEVGLSVVKKMDLNPKELQRDLVKNAIKRELQLK